MKNAVLTLDSLVCPSCLQKIEKGLASVEGIDKASIKVLFNASKAKFTFDEDQVAIEAIESKLADLGYDVKKRQLKEA